MSYEKYTETLHPLTQNQGRKELIIAALLIGLIATYIHWAGLILAGLLLGVLARNTRNALAYGIGFGVIVLLLFTAYMAFHGALGKYLAMDILLIANIGITLLLPTLSAGIRGILPR